MKCNFRFDTPPYGRGPPRPGHHRHLRKFICHCVWHLQSQLSGNTVQLGANRKNDAVTTRTWLQKTQRVRVRKIGQLTMGNQLHSEEWRVLNSQIGMAGVPLWGSPHRGSSTSFHWPTPKKQETGKYHSPRAQLEHGLWAGCPNPAKSDHDVGSPCDTSDNRIPLT